MKRKPQQQTDGKPDPQSQACAALLREINTAALSADDRRLITMVATQPTRDAVDHGKTALAAAINRTESKAR